jgi:hypothetical protein
MVHAFDPDTIMIRNSIFVVAAAAGNASDVIVPALVSTSTNVSVVAIEPLALLRTVFQRRAKPHRRASCYCSTSRPGAITPAVMPVLFSTPLIAASSSPPVRLSIGIRPDHQRNCGRSYYRRPATVSVSPVRAVMLKIVLTPPSSHICGLCHRDDHRKGQPNAAVPLARISEPEPAVIAGQGRADVARMWPEGRSHQTLGLPASAPILSKQPGSERPKWGHVTEQLLHTPAFRLAEVPCNSSISALRVVLGLKCGHVFSEIGPLPSLRPVYCRRTKCR